MPSKAPSLLALLLALFILTATAEKLKDKFSLKCGGAAAYVVVGYKSHDCSNTKDDDDQYFDFPDRCRYPGSQRIWYKNPFPDKGSDPEYACKDWLKRHTYKSFVVQNWVHEGKTGCTMRALEWPDCGGGTEYVHDFGEVELGKCYQVPEKTESVSLVCWPH